MNTIKIKYPTKRKPNIYEIKIDNLLFILSNFENKRLEFENLCQIKKLMKKYKLYNKFFLENLAKLK